MRPEQLNFTLNSGASVYINFSGQYPNGPQIAVTGHVKDAGLVTETEPDTISEPADEPVPADADPVLETVPDTDAEPDAETESDAGTNPRTENSEAQDKVPGTARENRQPDSSQELVSLRAKNKKLTALVTRLTVEASVMKSAHAELTDSFLSLQKKNEGLMAIKDKLVASETKASEENRRLKENAMKTAGVLDQNSKKIAELEQDIEEMKTSSDADKTTIDELRKANDSLISNETMYLEEITNLEESNKELRNTVASLEAHLEGLRNKAAGTAPVIFTGKERDLFPGEIADYVLEIIRNRLQGSLEKSRIHDVLTDILEANDYKGIHEQKREALKASVKKADGDAVKIDRALCDAGFEHVGTGKHNKYAFCGDARYSTVIAVTPSDHRATENMTSQIISQML